jgi:transcriptional regulator with XRE-family HTH domain
MTTLNIEAIKTAMADKGLSAAALAKSMDVSRESVSKWLNAEAVPRPSKLLKLCLLLGLTRSKLLGLPDQSAMQPQVAFRMARAKQAQAHHVVRARQMGKMLEGLVPHLPFDQFETPPALKNPSSDYAYLQALALALRKEMGVTETGAINIQTLANLFTKLQAVIVPVLWGHRKSHENAIHVYLPRTATTWVYLNLDTRLADLKFWLAHELGHTYTFTTLQGDAGEDFADGFAGALLFPEGLARPLYDELAHVRSIHQRVHRVKSVAESLEISIVCVGKQLDCYAAHHGLRKLIDEHRSLYQINEMSKPALASTSLLGEGEVDLEALVRISETVFHTPVYAALRSYLRQKKVTAGYVQGILDCSLVDAKQIVSELA